MVGWWIRSRPLVAPSGTLRARLILAGALVVALITPATGQQCPAPPFFMLLARQLPMPPDPRLLDAVGTVRDSPHRPAWDSLLLSSREWGVAAWGMCSLEARRLDVEQC